MNSGQPVYERNGLVKIAAYCSLLGILVTSPFCLPIILNLPWLLNRILNIKHPNEVWILGFTLWSVVGYLMLILNSFLLFTSKSEQLLKKYLMIVLYIGIVPFILIAIFGKSPYFLIYGFAVAILQRWMVNKVLS